MKIWNSSGVSLSVTAGGLWTWTLASFLFQNTFRLNVWNRNGDRWFSDPVGEVLYLVIVFINKVSHNKVAQTLVLLLLPLPWRYPLKRSLWRLLTKTVRILKPTLLLLPITGWFLCTLATTDTRFSSAATFATIQTFTSECCTNHCPCTAYTALHFLLPGRGNSGHMLHIPYMQMAVWVQHVLFLRQKLHGDRPACSGGSLDDIWACSQDKN